MKKILKNAAEISAIILNCKITNDLTAIYNEYN